MSAPALRIERIPAGAGPPAAFEALGARLGTSDRDPVPEAAERWLAWRGDEPQARLGALTARDLREAPGLSGLVGHYEAAAEEAGAALLRAACAALAEQGARRVLGPINGSTWHRYRLALPPLPGDPRFDPPVFFSEPANPAEYPGHFEAAGFVPAAGYESRIESPIAPADETAAREARERLARRGYTLRRLDPDRYEHELRPLWELSLESFADNPFYSPIGFEEFAALYRPLAGRLDQELVLFVDGPDGRLAGFLLTFADALGDRGAGPPRMVCKTLAVAPGARGLGLGNLLLDEARERGRRKGYAAAIDALMHVSNVSRHMSRRRDSKVFRRYALYQWTP